MNITVNAISPGATLTPRFKARSKAVHDATRRMTAVPRFAEPEEIAYVVLFLLK
jgi:NAD(P)-dependent dehydrogenase (short-subunit alcohol dehydrogenase family)